MLYSNILIDVSDLYKRCHFFSLKENSTSKDIINDTVLRTVRMILNIERKYLTNGKMWVLADNPTSQPQIRKMIDPEYKAYRMRESDTYYRGIDFVLLVFSKYSSIYNTARIKKAEADDLIKPLLDSFTNESSLLVSADMDWARGMSEKVHWLSKRKLYTQELFLQDYKFIPNEQTVTLYKCLLGCESDNIPAIPNINEQVALNIIHANFYDVFDLLDTIKYKKERCSIMSSYTQKVLLDNKDRLTLNHQLVYFNTISDSEIKAATTKGEYNQKALAILYQSLGFPKDFDNRIKYEKVEFKDMFGFDEVKRK